MDRVLEVLLINRLGPASEVHVMRAGTDGDSPELLREQPERRAAWGDELDPETALLLPQPDVLAELGERAQQQAEEARRVVVEFHRRSLRQPRDRLAVVDRVR